MGIFAGNGNPTTYFKMDKKFLRLLEYLAVIAAILILGVIMLPQARAGGGYGCPGVNHPTYKCTCENGRYETYMSNEDLKAAIANPHSCCYTKKVAKPVLSEWVELTKDQYTTGCWGYCLNVSFNGSAWKELNETGSYKVINNSWTEVEFDVETVFKFMSWIPFIS